MRRRGAAIRSRSSSSAIESEGYGRERRCSRRSGRDYDRWANILSFGQDPRWRRFLVSRLDARPLDTVLDVATGTAAVALELARQKDCYVVGVDQSAEMLEVGRQHVRLAGATEKVRLEQGDARSLPFDDGTFDGLTFTYLLRYVEDPAATLRELARVVKPGGVIAGLEFGVPRGVWRPPWELWVRAGLPGAGRVIGTAGTRSARFSGRRFLGRERTNRLGLDDVRMEILARETLDTLHVRTVTSVRQQVASLSGGQRQTVAIAKAVLWESKVVVLDEPTAALGVAQTRQVLDLVRRLADQGIGVVLISHNMNDVFEVADRIVTLYLGRVAAEVLRGETTHTQVVELITAGRSRRHRPPGRRAGPDLRTDRWRRPNAPRSPPRAPPSPRWASPRSSTRWAPPCGRTSCACAAATWAPCPPCSASWCCSCFSASPPARQLPLDPNFANLLTQAAPITLIGVGLVFVLLLGEIDLSAGGDRGCLCRVDGVAARQRLLAVDRAARGHRDRRGDRRAHRLARGAGWASPRSS